MYLFDGHAARRWLPPTAQLHPPHPLSVAGLAGQEKGKNKTFQALGQ